MKVSPLSRAIVARESMHGLSFPIDLSRFGRASSECAAGLFQLTRKIVKTRRASEHCQNPGVRREALRTSLSERGHRKI